MGEYQVDSRSKVHRGSHRATYDRDTIHSIIDEALYCEVAFEEDGQPYVIPTNHARVGDRLLLHGSPAGRKIKVIQQGKPLCISFTLLDGLVLSKTLTGHSVNYRSAIVFGTGEAVTDPDEKLAALRAIVEHVLPGRWNDALPSTEKELAATAVVAVTIDSVSAKIRSGPSGDPESDPHIPVWSGVLPVKQAFAAPVPDLRAADIEVPDYVRSNWRASTQSL